MEIFNKYLFPCLPQSVKTLDLEYYDHPSNLELSPSLAQTLTTLRLHRCGFWGRNSLDPFPSFINLKELYLDSCGFDHCGITFKITAPQLVRLDINFFTVLHTGVMFFQFAFGSSTVLGFAIKDV
ncbi:Leucine-rich repeat 2 [Corchorus capsularis]|uniref:Leucine-rich repeat 2 n=1 Tax=Corchorus capsularis TaxID=210143 RepID=A0A1R3IM03_COCAP|nr:Leucine-rich repeat 2 [Corchorus capsularis]